ncbi:MAG: hypothetical protein GWM93_10460, partial [Gemmatimonadetes bacterium]|nr:hypothetical protein [Gemmatimonadota bacterium]NIT67084.1 hypothetical protein [Gemmatimonadota bacterium]NIY35661.1 hypothetical protein [Gemmatimonadota bacterium]
MVSVSQFIRNVLEDTFDLVDGVLGSVDDIVTESREFASQVRRDAAHVASAARRRAEARRDPRRLNEDTAPPPAPADAEESASDAALSHVQ